MGNAEHDAKTPNGHLRRREEQRPPPLPPAGQSPLWPLKRGSGPCRIVHLLPGPERAHGTALRWHVKSFLSVLRHRVVSGEENEGYIHQWTADRLKMAMSDIADGRHPCNPGVELARSVKGGTCCPPHRRR